MAPIDEFFERPRTDASRLKAQIVATYFASWANILRSDLRPGNRLTYLDPFCGPGIYSGGEESTPMLVLKSALTVPRVREVFQAVFGDKEPQCLDRLKAAVSDAGLERRLKIRYVAQSAEESLDEFIAYRRQGPCYLFVDPFGYKGLSLEKLANFLGGYGCDCTFFFNLKRINPAISNPLFDANMIAVFGRDQTAALQTELQRVPPDTREDVLVTRTREILQSLAPSGKKILCTKPFRFGSPGQNRTSHFLFHASTHRKGIDLMRKIMSDASKDPQFGVGSFDFDPMRGESFQASLFSPLLDLEQELLEKFAGRTLTCAEVQKEHFRDLDQWTPANYKAVLLDLEQRGMITADPAVERRKAGTFGDNVRVTFPPKE